MITRVLVAIFCWLAASGVTVAAWAQSQPIADPTKAAAATAPTPPQHAAPPAVTYTAAYTVDLLDDVGGGRSPGAGYAELLKLAAAYDGAARGRDGLTALVSLEHTFGSDFTAQRVGGFQAVSSLQSQPAATRLYEAWAQQEFRGGALGLKAGFIDLNTTFDVQETAALFLNASHGTGADLADTGRNGPSIYPNTALAATAFWRPNEAWTGQVGVFDGVAGDPAHRADFAAVRLDGALMLGQVERRFGDAARLEGGVWSYTGRFPSLLETIQGPGRRRVAGDDGVYALAEGRLLPRSGDTGAGLSGWIRLGRANGDINPVRGYLGAGLVYAGPFASREKDEAGLALARASFGAGAHAAGLADGRNIGGAETVVEATYRYVVADWVSLQPDLQYVIRPHGDAGLPNAIVLGLRAAFTYSH